MYLLADSKEGQIKEAELSRSVTSESTTYGNIKHGFVYQRVPHITLKSIANNAEIDVIWDGFQSKLEPLREKLNAAVNESWEEWEIPRDVNADWSSECKRCTLNGGSSALLARRRSTHPLPLKQITSISTTNPMRIRRKFEWQVHSRSRVWSPHRVLELR